MRSGHPARIGGEDRDALRVPVRRVRTYRSIVTRETRSRWHGPSAPRNNDAYRPAVDRFALIGSLMAAAGQPAALAPYVAGVGARLVPSATSSRSWTQRGWCQRRIRP